MQDPQNPNDASVIEIKKPLLKKTRGKRKKLTSGYRVREHYLADHEKGSVKVYSERLQAGLMIFPHQQEFRHHEPSKGYAVCPYDLVAGKVKWRPRIFGLKKGKAPHFVYDMIHIDEGEVKKFLGALAYIAELTPHRPGHQGGSEKTETTISDIDQKIMKFRL